MTRNEKRQLKRKNKKKLETYKPLSKSYRIFIISISLIMILSFLYLSLSDHLRLNNELVSINVSLKSSPKYHEYKIKSTTYRDIILTTEEYNKEFRIMSMTYKATNHEEFKTDIKSGDKIELNVLKSDVSELNKHSFWNDYNEVYGLTKDGKNYIDIELRTKLVDDDIKWGYIFVVIGLAMLPYGFLKRKPLISMDKVITTICVIALILILIEKRV